MRILLDDVGKRFNKNWIFRRVNVEFEEGKVYALTGNNGSGKTTLLKLISGISQPTEGKIDYFLNGKQLKVDAIFRDLVYVGPYTELIEEFTLNEIISFYSNLKQLTVQKSLLIEKLGLKSVQNRYIKHYSSGMKQKVKLGLALYTKCDLLLLDEPTTNFDNFNTNWYLKQLAKLKDKTIIIGSNQKYEYSFCDEVLDLTDYKY